MKKPEPALAPAAKLKVSTPATATTVSKAPSTQAAQGTPSPLSALKKTAMELLRISKLEVKLSDIAAATAGGAAPALQALKDKAELKPSAELFAELTSSAQPSVRLGLLCKCYISGCDVHMISEEQQITAHFPVEEPLPPGFQEARHLVARMPSKYLALVVYSNRTEALLPDGSTIKFP